ncbi:lysophospholipid acyltransferase family protein [Methylacidiphilum caldifontis]|uniref:Acyl-phosphate glycerol 3-phosphate acyltransferase n=1 Tax=Methylacidiphilum caldifontis TaxID=2795386 RepID=A0A4Y8P802_9BACT|nr:lysophospholipid acyltransferase family protein [Methylacidiphilum caldifontis]TFE66538.1 acyl-phosphate glycerol 3-phosphate acyltransferase [Methylacidiphilum caldifontis]
MNQKARDGFFFFSGFICKRILNLSSKIHIDGLDRIPLNGGCLLVSNHISHFDPIILGMHAPRPIDYVADGKLFNDLVLCQILTNLNVIPVDRERMDPKAAKSIVSRLKAGRLVGLFPERGIRHGKNSILLGASLSFSPAILSQLSQCPILPVVIIGSDLLYQPKTWFYKPRIFVKFGELIFPERTEKRAELTKRIHDSLLLYFWQLVKQHNIEPFEWPCSAQQRWKENPRRIR